MLDAVATTGQGKFVLNSGAPLEEARYPLSPRSIANRRRPTSGQLRINCGGGADRVRA